MDGWMFAGGRIDEGGFAGGALEFTRVKRLKCPHLPRVHLLL